MSMAAMTELEALLGEVADDDSVHVLVLTGGVDGYFVAHADVEDLAKLGAGEPVEGDPGSWSRAFALLEAMPQPVVAAVDGQAWGGGSELCWACTTRVASAAATFGQPEVLVGIIPGAGGTQRLPRLIGAGRAAELILSGRIVAADEALRLGMVEAVLPREGFLDAALAWAGRFATPPRPAVVAAKRAVVDGLRLPLDEGLRREGELFLACQTRPDTLAIQGEVVRRYAGASEDERLTLDPD
jgi:enoyl-CoA hydratase